MLQPRNDWALVQLEPLPEERISSGIVRVDPELIRKGTVISVGAGKHYVDKVYRPTELKPGDRVAFMAAALDHKQGRQLAHSLNDDQALIRETDVLFVIEDGDPKVEK